MRFRCYLNLFTLPYHAALARAPEERAAFLSNACDGDEVLRQEVESLLHYESASARFLETPAAAVVAGAPGESPMVNRQIGSYTIVAPLGAGGMGEVYRARDSKLGRDVAIKILRSHFTADPERRAPFAREARLLATLNHPTALANKCICSGRCAGYVEQTGRFAIAARSRPGTNFQAPASTRKMYPCRGAATRPSEP